MISMGRNTATQKGKVPRFKVVLAARRSIAGNEGVEKDCGNYSSVKGGEGRGERRNRIIGCEL